MPTLPSRAKDMLGAVNFATVATIQAGGDPQTSVVWVRADGDDVLFSTIKGRRKYANLTRDPRVSVLVWDAANPYLYCEIRGTAEITEDPEAGLIEELALKYTGQSFGDRPGEQRVIVRVRPDHVVVYDD